MNKIKIMLVEDHQIVREGLRRLLEMEPHMEVVAEAGTCQEALANVREDIDIILLDIKLPDGDGLDLCRELKQKIPRVRFIALTTYDDAHFIKKAIARGVHGFIPKYASFDAIKSAITMTQRDGRYLYPGLNMEMLMNPAGAGLTEPERKILQMIARGETQKTVAATLFMSVSTLRRRLKGICTKLGVDTIEEALTSAVKKGLIE